MYVCLITRKLCFYDSVGIGIGCVAAVKLTTGIISPFLFGTLYKECNKANVPWVPFWSAAIFVTLSYPIASLLQNVLQEKRNKVCYFSKRRSHFRIYMNFSRIFQEFFKNFSRLFEFSHNFSTIFQQDSNFSRNLRIFEEFSKNF